MNKMLIGHNGFVGSNLKQQMKFDYLVNSKNINEAAGVSVNELFISAGDARKWMANQNPENDLLHIKKLFSDVSKVTANKVFLFSTIDVYASKDGVYEGGGQVSTEPYGKHRKLFEEMICSHFNNVTIIRLPGLFGSGLKKNIIFDILNKKDISGFNLNSYFQWFCLNDLNRVIDYCKQCSLQELNVTSAPVSVAELCNALNVDTQLLSIESKLVYYNICSKFSIDFSGSEDYLYSKEKTLAFILDYVKGVNL